MASALSDREEDGLLGPVQSVETRESLLVQTDRYDSSGRVTERLQGGKEPSQGLWPLRFSYRYDQAGRRISEAVHDARGELVKETRSAYDDHGDRSAEVAAWGDGTFENASLYEYDEAHRTKRGLHYNAVQVINRNLFAYDEAGRLTRERFERNYRYDQAGNLMVTTDRFDAGYEVAISYDGQGHVSEKVVSDLKGRRQGRSEFRYDEHGNQIEERSYDAEGRLTDRKAYRYDYDAVGNWIQETIQWWNATHGREKLKEFHIRERTITYY
jgi:YD repeat-containing protein